MLARVTADNPPSPFAAFPAATDQSFVVAQLGQSLDGRIATPTGDSRYINGPQALDHLHRIRAHVDAVLVGVGTVLADDPQLTVRRVPGRNPVRVILDPRGRMPASARCLSADAVPCLVIRTVEAEAPPGAEVIRLPGRDGRVEPPAIVEALVRRGLGRILIEGGARTISSFLDADCIDRLHLLVGPVIIGSGPSGLALRPIQALAEARRPATQVHLLADNNVLFDCDMRAS